MIENRTFWETENKVDIAIARLREFCPPEGYYLAFSGGKDSITIKRLADMADVKYDAYFHVTTVDPPELLRYIRRNHPGVKWTYPEMSMYRLIIKKKYPPTRMSRYCCEALKEYGGIGRFLVTGIRWEESSKRRQRRMVETCQKQRTKRFIHPIIDWTEEDVWKFIREEALPYCCLYVKGYTRIGCIMCPAASKKCRVRDMKRYPRHYDLYLRAFEKMLSARRAANMQTDAWQSAEDVMEWWLYHVKYDHRQLIFPQFE